MLVSKSRNANSDMHKKINKKIKSVQVVTESHSTVDLRSASISRYSIQVFGIHTQYNVHGKKHRLPKMNTGSIHS